jgi:CubicO group peptidase (beta-lactamase class C family)
MRTLLVALGVGLVACGGGSAPPDVGSPGLDASSPRDAAPALDVSSASPDADVAGPDGQAPGPDAQAPGPDAAAPDTGPDPHRFDPIEASLETERKGFGEPGLAVAIVEGGQVTYSKGFGLKDPGDPASTMQPTTNFRLASMTKQLTTAGLLQQVAAGKVSLDEPITTYIPDFGLEPDVSKTVLVRHLLTHTTGFRDYLEQAAPASEMSDSDLNKFFTYGRYQSAGWFMSPPGRMWNYSNPNFMIAGLVIERTSGQYYRTYMANKVFKPLGMTRTFFLPSDVLKDGDYAIGDGFDDKGNPALFKPDSYDNVWARPCGYAFSNVLDLAKWATFLMEGNDAVLPKVQRLDMQTYQVNTETYLDISGYGFGLAVDKGLLTTDSRYIPETQVFHDGKLAGFATLIWMVPEHDFAIITLANKDDAYFWNSIALAIEQLTPHAASIATPDPRIDPSTFGNYVAQFNDPNQFGDVIVTLEDSKLKLSIPQLDAWSVPYSSELTPTSERNFTLTIQGVPWQVTFIMDSTGKVEYFRTRVFVAKYVGPPAGPSPAPRHATRAEVLEHLHRVSREMDRAPAHR